MPYWVYLLLAGVVILAAVILGRAALFRSRRYAVDPERGIKIEVDRAPLSSLSITWSRPIPPPMRSWSGRLSTATACFTAGKGARRA
jgi:hypothetical protein